MRILNLINSLPRKASKRVNKLTSIFGFVDNSNVNDILTKEQQNNDDYKRKEEASRSLKLQHWLGIDANEKKSRSKQHKKSKSIDEVKLTCL